MATFFFFSLGVLVKNEPHKTWFTFLSKFVKDYIVKESISMSFQKVKTSLAIFSASPSSNSESLAGENWTTEVDGSFLWTAAAEDIRPGHPAAKQLTSNCPVY